MMSNKLMKGPRDPFPSLRGDGRRRPGKRGRLASGVRWRISGPLLFAGARRRRPVRASRSSGPLAGGTLPVPDSPPRRPVYRPDAPVVESGWPDGAAKVSSTRTEPRKERGRGLARQTGKGARCGALRVNAGCARARFRRRRAPSWSSRARLRRAGSVHLRNRSSQSSRARSRPRSRCSGLLTPKRRHPGGDLDSGSQRWPSSARRASGRSSRGTPHCTPAHHPRAARAAGGED